MYDWFRDSIHHKWKVSRAKKSTFEQKFVFLMMLAVLKNSGQWGIMGRAFQVNDSTFEKLIYRFTTILSLLIYKDLVTRLSAKWTMNRLVEEQCMFITFKHARYATDVTLQQSNLPSGNIRLKKV